VKLFVNYLVALYALVGIIAGIILLGAWGYLMAIFAAGGDGSGGDALSETLKAWIIGIAVWIFPTLAFIFMLLGSFNRLKGIMHSIGYWYSLICSVAITVTFFLFSFNRPMLKWIGLFSLFITFLWGYAFRNTPAANPNGSRNLQP
jgi:hypothetical protein